jgi:ABC-type phosphate transport system ATPase subunit
MLRPYRIYGVLSSPRVGPLGCGEERILRLLLRMSETSKASDGEPKFRTRSW